MLFVFFRSFVIMPIKKNYIFLFFLLFSSLIQGQQNISIKGSITNEEGIPVPYVNIQIICPEYQSITISDKSGHYKAGIPKNAPCKLIFILLGYETDTLIVDQNKPQTQYNPTLKTNFTFLDAIDITGKQERHTTMSRINIENFEAIPDISGSVETMIVSLPGVSSSNEMTSQYSVRGGNFDENLVYVNDIEIYRPFLIRSGQQEGLSFINSDLISSLTFSAGGFDASYGDKMSSVLDISYKTPQQFRGSSSISMLGGTAHLEGATSNQRLTHISGFRYKENSYLLGTLDTKGDYDPTFADFQTYVNYRFSPTFHLSFLGNYANNTYLFSPEKRETTFGTITTPLSLTIFYDGMEQSQFKTLFGALSFNFYPTDKLTLKLITGAFHTDEEETFDIRGRYRIDEVDNIMSTSSESDSSKNIGVGTKLDHARNFLDARVYTSNLKMSYHHNFLSVNTGIKYQFESFHDQLNEWEMLDSSGYSLPYSDEELLLYNSRIAEHQMSNHRITSYIQARRFFNTKIGEIHFTGGIRTNYWSFNEEFFMSPRMTVSITPPWIRDFLFRFSAGYYNQSPFYKEIRYPDGTINPEIQSQKSIHYVIGSDYNFQAWERPFKFTAEAYYKQMYDLIPYRVDNVRIIYAGENIARGYARGIDLRIHGEFVKDAESWLSLSFMDSKQKLISEPTFEDPQLNETSGYFPRPTDQLFNIGLLFQDYLPNNPSYRIQLNLNYGSGLPVSYPNSMITENDMRLPAYRRVDIAMYKHFKSEEVENNAAIFKHFTNVAIGIEVFNLFDINNTISYMWIKTISSNPETPSMFAIPNYLTGRIFNLKLSCKF